MNLLNLIEDANTGYDNLRALMQAVQNSQDAVLTVGSEPITLTYPEARFMFGKYKAYNKAGRQEEFIADLGDPVKFDLHMKQLRQLLDKQKNFRGSVPGERGVAGDVPAGMAEETVEEIAMNNPDRPTTETAGKINWERMLQDYMANKPYTEFEFGDSDRPLTIYRSQIYAILKDFGRMKPGQKVNLIVTTFGDKTSMVNYIDKLRSQGMMPKKVPPYISPDAPKISPGQMELPGLGAPRIKEAEAQKKNSSQPTLGAGTARSPKVQRAFQLARARQAAAGSDIEAFVKDELEKAEQAQAEIEQLRGENDRQDQQIQQLAAKVRQQDQEINQIQQPTAVAPPKAEPPKEKPKAAKPEKKDEPKKKAQPTAAEKPVEPVKGTEPRAEPAPDTIDQPAPTQQPTPIQSEPYVELPPNVVQFPVPAQKKKKATRGRRKKTADVVPMDPVAAAMQGVGIGRAVGMNEAQDELHIGDPVIIQGNVEFGGKTGDVVDFGRDKNFVIVDLYNFGRHAFHASNVKRNDYADSEDYLDEMQTKLDRVNINQPPPGGTNKEREAFLDARDRLFRQMAHASPGEKEAIRLKIAELEGRAQAQGIRIREAGEFNRGGYNAIRNVSDWAEKMRVMRELQKDPNLMKDPEAQVAIKQRLSDLLDTGIKQGYIKEALSDKAMAVLRGLKTTGQAQTPAAVSPEKQAEIDQWAQDFQRNVAGPMGRQVVPAPAPIDLNVPDTPKARRGRPSNAERAQRHQEFLDLRRRIEQLDQLIKMKEQIDKLFIKAQNVRGGIYPGLQADIEAEELYPVPQTDQDYEDLKAKYAKDLDALQKFLAMKKAVYREGQDRVSESTALVRLQQARQALAQQQQQGVAEGHADQQRKIFKKNGRPVGEVGIDRESSPGVGQWYMKCYAYDVDNSGYDSYEEAVAELKHCLKQGVAEGSDDDIWGPQGNFAGDTKVDVGGVSMKKIKVGDTVRYFGEKAQVVALNTANDRARITANGKTLNVRLSDLRPLGQGVAEGMGGGEYGRVLDALKLYYPRVSMEELNVPGYHKVIANKANVPVEYAAQVINDFVKASDPNDYEDWPEDDEQGVAEGICSECGGPSFSDMILAEKQDACYHKVRSRYKVWPSAYASGALVQCRKKGAANWGNKSKNENVNEFKRPRDPWGDDDRGEDPYSRPEPKHYARSIDYFGRFEADHFDREDFDERTGVFKGYWQEDDGSFIQIGYFKFDDPQRAGSDDPGMGWYYEPQ